MAEELGVERNGEQRGSIAVRRQALDLPRTALDEMLGMQRGLRRGPLRHVRLLVIAGAGDAMILESRRYPLTRRRQERPHVVVVEVEADIAVEIAVVEISGI